MLEFFRDYLAPSGGIHVVSILPDAFDPADAVKGKHFGTDYEGASAWCLAENAAGRNVYWTANVVRPDLHKKPTKADITAIRVAHVDIDPPKDNPAWDKQAALVDLQNRGAPSVIISSGAGWQALWWLNEATDAETVEQVNRGLAAAFNADHCWNVDRLLRVPGGGLINWPDKRKQSLGRVPVATALQQPFNGAAYSPAQLLATFPAPVAPATIVTALPDGPRDDYTGPADDDELIRMMLRSRGGMGAMFGEKATVADLWEADPAVMAKFFPSDSGDDFNRSSADAALLAHLTFWTGNDPARIDRLFRRSGLMRDKWNRESYRVMSIGKAVAACVNVYSREPDTNHVEPSRSVNVTSLPGVTAEPSGEFLTIHEQKEYFKGCVFVADLNEVLTPSGAFMKPATFNAMYGGHSFELGTDKAESKAFVAFTESRLHKFPKVQQTMFEPNMPFAHIDTHRSAVNVYKPDPSVKSEPGDVTPFLQHLERMLPDERDRRILLTWMASLVQNPGVKFQWAPFLQGSQGNGKSMIGQILKRAVGTIYTHEPFSDDLANKFNDWQDNKVLIIVEELSLGEKLETDNNLKTWITQDMIEMQAKGGKKAMRPNKANWIIFSNYQNGLVFTAGGRRYAPFFTAQQSAEDIERAGMGGNYFPFMWEWLRRGGYAFMTHFLKTYECDPEFDPAGTLAGAARAPDTSSTMAAIGASMGRFEMELLEMVESGAPGFRNGWVSGTKLRELEDKLRLRMSAVRRKAALESLGYVPWGRSTQMIMSEGGAKPVLYVKKGLETASLQHFLESQGYAA